MPIPTVSATKRRELQQLFDRAIRLEQDPAASREEIRRLLGQCVAADPANLLYVDALLRQAERREATGESWWDRVFDPRAKLKHAAQIEDWPEVTRLGVELLTKRPRDVEALCRLAQAAAGYDAGEVELRWLHSAVRAAPEDAAAQQQLARTLTRLGHFEAAAKAWQRLLALDPVDHEAPAALARLTGGESRTPGLRLTELQARVAENPPEREPYLQLVDELVAANRFEEAEATLARARPILGSVLELAEKLEQVMTARAQRQLAIAEKQAEALPPLPAIDLVEQARANLARVELQVLSTRSQRNPQDKQLLYEIGLRLKRLKNYSEALKYLTEAAADPRLAPAATVEIGECWQHLRQFPKALDFYRQAAELAEKAQAEGSLPLACYRAGVLADAMGDYPAARLWLTRAVAAEPGYRDAQARLDKLPPE